MKSELDHLVVTAPTLAAGVEYVTDAIGVTPQVGGEHEKMGTHNRLLKLDQRRYLEVIATNPAAPQPEGSRWFELDAAADVKVVRMATWVVRTDDIRAAVAAAPFPVGRIETMSRGEFKWEIALLEDGGLLCDGVAPMLIQWLGPHPCDKMQDSGCSLLGLHGFHPQPDKVDAFLSAIGFSGDFGVAIPSDGRGPGLRAHFQTPGGQRKLPPPSQN